MSHETGPDLIKVTEIFLIPSSFLVAALGTADTNVHRAAVSVIGLLVSGLWWICTHEALAERRQSVTDGIAKAYSRRIRILAWLPIFFSVSWLISTIAHGLMWNRPLGTIP